MLTTIEDRVITSYSLFNQVITLHGRKVLAVPVPEQLKDRICSDCGGPAKFIMVEMDKHLSPNGHTNTKAWNYCGVCEIGG